jgi:glucose/arabinose dehydrogenase
MDKFKATVLAVPDRRRRLYRRVCRGIVGLVANLMLTPTAPAATVPSGFLDSTYVELPSDATAMQFAPDGRLFVCQQSGKLRVVQNGNLLTTPFVTLSVAASGERGLLGVAFDPDFATNHFVYVYYTATTPTIHNRVSRFTANGNVAVAGSERVLLDLEPLSTATVHNGGAIHFGNDGKLYIAVGDNSQGGRAQKLAYTYGKVLRINRDGTIPTSNPFFATATGVNRSIWALGLRNPFTTAFQRSTGRFFINERCRKIDLRGNQRRCLGRQLRLAAGGGTFGRSRLQRSLLFLPPRQRRLRDHRWRVL